MVDCGKRKCGAVLVILPTAVVLLTIMLMNTIVGAARADSASGENTYGAVRVEGAGIHRIPGPLIAYPAGPAVTFRLNLQRKAGPLPNDAPFGPNVRVWDSPSEDTRPSVVVNSTGAVFVAFQHFTGSNWDIYLAISTDNGATFPTVGPVANTAANEVNPSLALTSTGAFALAYEQDAFSDSLYILKSLDSWANYAPYVLILPFDGNLTQAKFPSIAAQTTVGSFPDGVFVAAQVWCTDAVECEGGASAIFYAGTSAWSAPSPNFSLGLSYFEAKAKRVDSSAFVNDLHPSVAWSSGGVAFAFDDEWWGGPGYTDWRLVLFICAEAGDCSTFNAWTSVPVGRGTGLFPSVSESGNNVLVAASFLNASVFPSNPSHHNIFYMGSKDGGWSMSSWGLIDAAVTDQRSVSVSGIGDEFHFTYYSDSVMTHRMTPNVGTSLNPVQKVSDNAGTAASNDKATSVFVGAGGYTRVAWQDNRDGNVNIYTTSYGTFPLTYPVWINSTCAGSPSTMNVVIDATRIRTPYSTSWAFNSVHTVTVNPTEQTKDFCTRCVFAQWSDGSRNPTKMITVSGAVKLEARFGVKYRVEASAGPPGPSLNVTWNGTTGYAPVVSFEYPGIYQAAAPSPQFITADTRFVFRNWTGDVNSTNNAVGVSVPGPSICVNITANFDLEYLITIETTPSGLKVGWDLIPIDTPAPRAFWAVPGTRYTLRTISPQPDATDPNNIRYTFSRWVGGPAMRDWTITVTGPWTYTAYFSTEYKITVLSSIAPNGPGLAVDKGDCVGGSTTGKSPLECWEPENDFVNLMMTSPQVSGGSRFVFDQYSDGNTELIRLIGPVTGPATYLSMWDAEYYLTMVMDISCDQSTVAPLSGWLGSWELVNISWFPPTGLPPDERYVFEKWEGVGLGSYTGSNSAASVTMGSEIAETAFCLHRYQIVLDTVPGGLQYTVDNTMVFAGNQVFWWMAGSTHWVSVTTTTQPGAPGVQFVFKQWEDGILTPDRMFTVSRGGAYRMLFTTRNKLTLIQIPAVPAGLGDPRCSPNADCWFDEAGQATVSLSSTTWPPSSQYVRYLFQSWSGAYTGTNAMFVLTMDGPKTVTATWYRQYQVAAATAHSSIACSPSTDCWFIENAQATLTLAETTVLGGTGTRHVFTGWTGDATGASNPITMTMNAPKNTTAGWKTQYMLAIDSTCGTTVDCGSPVGNGWYDVNHTATISITSPFTDLSGNKWYFVRWSGDAGGTDPTVDVNMDGPKNATVIWMMQTMYRLAVVTPHGIPTCSPNADCLFLPDSMATVTLSALQINGPPGTRYVFNEWTGDATNSSHPLLLRMDGAKTVTAIWETQYLLTIISRCGSEDNCGSPIGAGWHAEGNVTSISVNSTHSDPSGGVWEFQNWTWTGQGSANTTTAAITMDGAKTASAAWRERTRGGDQPQVGLGLEAWMIVAIVAVIVAATVILGVLFAKRKKSATEEKKAPQEKKPDKPIPPISGTE